MPGVFRYGELADPLDEARCPCGDSIYRQPMASIDPTGLDRLFAAAVTGFSVLGGVMATYSGFRAAFAMRAGRPAQEVGIAVNTGLGAGFLDGAIPAMLAFMISLT